MSIETPNSLDYFYYPITKSKINVSVRAAHDARICLRTNLTDDTLDAYEIIIGGCGNKKSFLKNTNTGQILKEVETDSIVSEEEYSYFQIQWFCDGYLSVKFENEHSHIFSYHNKEPFPINYIGFSTAYGATGEWTFDEGEMTAAAVRPQLFEMYKNWIDYEPTRGLPFDAVSGDREDDSLFIGRSRHKNSLTPGIITNFICRICWGGHTHDKRQFQVLCGVGVGWAKCCNGAVPMGALPAGETENGLALFVGRVIQDGQVLIGKVQPNHQVCYVPVNGREVSFSEYYVLVVDEFAAIEWVGR
ncbi:uncharacterized protein LOC131667678 [Phymastichus coffea]|uniref:uncharacterized protein LOC131667678 n=1 Tax=Phymastichus coffea TaxID=108790 RepID=UPI00273BC915|nr:uncharacterized protein LOC131667678 [Phymastichus coffea]